MSLRRRLSWCFVAAVAAGVMGVGGASADPPFWATLTPDCSSTVLAQNVPDGDQPVARIVSSNSTVDLSGPPLWGSISWVGSDTFWVPLDMVGEVSFGMSCSGSGFEMDLADLQRPPVSFTGATTAGAEVIERWTDPHSSTPAVMPGESQLPFLAPINDDYKAEVAVSQGAITLDNAGHKQTFASAGKFDFGQPYRTPGRIDLAVETQPGPQAHWTITIIPAPLRLTRATASRRYIRPSGIDHIDYTLSSDATVNIDVHGPKGTVRPLVMNLKQALGENRIHWDGLDANHEPVPQGTYRVEIRAVNIFGSAAGRSVTVGVDTQPPRVAFGFGNRVKPRQSLEFRISDALSGWKTARVYLDGRAAGFHSTRTGAHGFTVSPRIAWPLARHRLTVVATDRVGNRRSYSKGFRVP
jgi:hypothetical protein